MSDTELRVLQVSFHLFFKIILLNKYYYLHFSNKETETEERSRNVPKLTLQVNGRTEL